MNEAETPKNRNAEARSLEDRRYHQRVVRSKKLYTRKPRNDRSGASDLAAGG